MSTPFDKVIEEIKARGYHNHRLDEHSDTVSNGILHDLLARCKPLRRDFDSGEVRSWLNHQTPGARGRLSDLMVAEANHDGSPNLDKLRIFIENKSVITAHRNRDARFDDLNQALEDIHRVRAEAVLVATVMVGLADRVLNVPDGVKKRYRKNPGEFEKVVLPRLSSGDQSLWDEFEDAVSTNKADDPRKTVEKFRQLRTREPGLTHKVGYDYVLLAPVHIDNVNPPSVPRANLLGIDLDRAYLAMLEQICKAYRTRGSGRFSILIR
ncbi:MAG: hypothetical protein WCE23_01320 [Candidatus Binatus sp.]|uniref:hypothetical protein n=1 Tax=Candidatus Binatus sp. TaxID=2811406 RepID=UPI003C74C2E4